MTEDDLVILKSIEMLKSGQMTTREDVGQGWQDTTAKSLEMMTRTAKRLGLLDAESPDA